jgi:hypothetical protein
MTQTCQFESSKTGLWVWHNILMKGFFLHCTKFGKCRGGVHFTNSLLYPLINAMGCVLLTGMALWRSAADKIPGLFSVSVIWNFFIATSGERGGGGGGGRDTQIPCSKLIPELSL